MTEDKGKILLSGFDLEPEEKSAINNLVENYADKINQKTGFEEIRLRLKKSQHGKAFLHEVQGTLKIQEINKIFKAEITDYNLFSALAEVLGKLMKEAEHNKRTSRQVK